MYLDRNKIKNLFIKADSGGFAIPAFNYSDIWDFLSIIEAAEEENAPIMISSNPLVVSNIGIELCGALGLAAMKKARVPIVHHLDHSISVDMCKSAVNNNYSSVMLDYSRYSLQENIENVSSVVRYAHKHNVFVEGEVGRIKGAGIDGKFEGSDFLTQVEDAVTFVKKTKVDSLAIGIGTAHGFYEKKPEINFKRLAEINDSVEIPLVLHGGTGIPAKDIKKAIKLGINKVNVGTIIYCTYMNCLKDELMERDRNQYTLDIMKPVREEIKKVVKMWIRVCGVNGKA